MKKSHLEKSCHGVYLEEEEEEEEEKEEEEEEDLKIRGYRNNNWNERTEK